MVNHIWTLITNMSINLNLNIDFYLTMCLYNVFETLEHNIQD